MSSRLIAKLFMAVVLAGTASWFPAQGQDAEIPFLDLTKVADDAAPGAGPLRRNANFLKKWTKFRTDWAGRVDQDQQAVVFLGDSITEGWRENFRGQFPGMKTANRGIGGDTTRGMLLRLQSDVLSLNPSCVVMLMGTNDLAEKATPETIAGNFKLIVDALKTHNPKLPIVVCQMFPSSATKQRPVESIKKVNELYAAAVKGDPQVTVVDTWTLFANEQGDAKPELFPDLLHLNDQAYGMWGASLRPIFATLGFLETTADDFRPEEGFVSLFNGTDLKGWGFRDQKTLEKKESYEGVASSDGRYVAMHGRIVVKTPPEGRRVQQMWTTEEFPQNFVLKLEFRATPNADSGVFIRQPQLQCRDYPLAGPYKMLTNYKPQDWNELVVTVKDGAAHCTCNGEVLEAAMKVPPTGPIGLEGDRGQMEYRRIRLKEIP